MPDCVFTEPGAGPDIKIDGISTHGFRVAGDGHVDCATRRKFSPYML